MADIEKGVDEEIGDVQKKAMPTAETDDALKFLRRDDEHGAFEDIDEKVLLRKIDWMVMPVRFPLHSWLFLTNRFIQLMFSCYILQYLDKTLINYANVMGLRQDTGTSATQFSYLALAFYVSYCVCEIPQGYLMQRFPTAKYLGSQVILWG